ncbi:uncharacterized protein LOC124556052 [Schistocerca americana]|uniref:uncharacterized protein LOC124556052 n=1 Tax=Schistocerca americana TaxID=7009 RepID=UPI001F4FB8CA|nr:uncharacterized protein LOC124556052 [Schistocerca americana]
MGDPNLLSPQAAASSVGETVPPPPPPPPTTPPQPNGAEVSADSTHRGVQKSPKRHKKRRLSAEEWDRGVTMAEDINSVDAPTVATDSTGLIHRKAPDDKEHSPTSGGPENEAHRVDSQNVGSCESGQPPLTSQSSLGDWADDMEADDAQHTSLPPPEPMADIEPGGLCESADHMAQ